MHTYDCVAMVLPQVEFLEKKDMKKTLRPRASGGKKLKKKQARYRRLQGNLERVNIAVREMKATERNTGNNSVAIHCPPGYI